MTDAETIAELRALLAERDAEIAALREARKATGKVVDDLLWDKYRIRRSPGRDACP